MKKILAWLLVGMLLLSAAAFAEAPAGYNSLEEHLAAFFGGVSPANGDICLSGSAAGRSAELIVSGPENVGNIELRVDGQSLGTLQIDEEAVYLNIEGDTVAIKMEDLMNLSAEIRDTQMQAIQEQITQLLTGFVTNMGIDPAQISQMMADGQSMLELLKRFGTQLLPALGMTVDETATTITLNSEALGTLTGDAVDALLNDPEAQRLMATYLPMAGIQADAEAMLQSWAEYKPAVAELLKGLAVKVKVPNDGSGFTLDAGFTVPGNMPESYGLYLTVSDKQGPGPQKEQIISGTATSDTYRGSDHYDFDVHITEGRGAVGDTCTMDIVSFEDTYVKQDMHLVVMTDLRGVPAYLRLSGSDEDRVFVCVRYANGRFSITADGKEVLSVMRQDDRIVAFLQGMKIVGEVAELDADHITLLATGTRYGRSTPVTLTLAIGQEAGREHLDLSLAQDGNVIAEASLKQRDPQPFDRFSDGEVQWLDEATLKALIQSGIQGAMVSAGVPAA
ncbi:MAG: hypothetical protein IJJ45_04520 [Clostridia bacterium]|nr:hypothetical protein [Clostridia bacterium]